MAKLALACIGGEAYCAGRAARPLFVTYGQTLLHTLPLFYLQIDFSSISYCHIRHLLGAKLSILPYRGLCPWIPMGARSQTPTLALTLYVTQCLHALLSFQISQN